MDSKEIFSVSSSLIFPPAVFFLPRLVVDSPAVLASLFPDQTTISQLNQVPCSSSVRLKVYYTMTHSIFLAAETSYLLSQLNNSDFASDSA